MKKLNYLFCLAIVMVIANLPLSGQPQLKKWFLNGKSVDFSSTLPLVETVDFSVDPMLTSGGAYNAVYGFEKNLLLYVQGRSIYNRFGTEIHRILSAPPEGVSEPPAGTGLAFIDPEVLIVPVPNTCKYYVIHNVERFDPSATFNHDNDVLYTLIDMTLNNGLGGVALDDMDCAYPNS